MYSLPFAGSCIEPWLISKFETVMEVGTQFAILVLNYTMPTDVVYLASFDVSLFPQVVIALTGGELVYFEMDPVSEPPVPCLGQIRVGKHPVS